MKKILWFIGILGNIGFLLVFLVYLIKYPSRFSISSAFPIILALVINIWYYCITLKSNIKSNSNIISFYFKRKKVEEEIKMLEARKHLESLKNTASSENVKQ